MTHISLRDRLTQIMQFDETLLKKIEALTISDISSIARAKELRSEAVKHEKMVEEMRIEAVRPYLEAQRKINDKAQTYVEKLSGTKDLLDRKIKDYENARRQEEARIAKIESDTIIAINNAKTNEEAENIHANCGISNATLDLVLAQRLQSPEAFNKAVTKLENEVVIDKKVKGVSERWDFEIEDPRRVPRQLCTPNEKLIRAAITTENVREIPGVKIFKALVVR